MSAERIAELKAKMQDEYHVAVDAAFELVSLLEAEIGRLKAVVQEGCDLIQRGARDRARKDAALKGCRKALAVLRSMCLTAGLKLGAAKADEILAWIAEATGAAERFPDPPHDALRTPSPSRQE